MYKAITTNNGTLFLHHYHIIMLRRMKKQCTRWEIAKEKKIKRENGLSAIVLNSNTATGWCGVRTAVVVRLPAHPPTLQVLSVSAPM